MGPSGLAVDKTDVTFAPWAAGLPGFTKPVASGGNPSSSRGRIPNHSYGLAEESHLPSFNRY
jgi:hypothetical protein